MAIKREACFIANMWVFLILIAICTIFVEPNGQKDYGTFNLTITEFEVCKGPKKKDCAASSVVITNSSTLLYNLTVFENVSPTKGKIVATTDGKDVLRLQVKKPCDHLFLRPLFNSLMNLTKDCHVLKGQYNLKIDILGISEAYFGGAFVFGKWTFKSLFYNDFCNFACANIQVVMSPKKKET